MCFEANSLRGSDVADIFEKGLGFIPRRIRSTSFRGNFSQKWLAELRGKEDVQNIHVTGKDNDGPSFQVFSLGVWSLQVAIWENYSQFPDDGMIEALSRARTFNAAYVAEAEDVQWQSETEISNYALFGKDHSTLPKRLDSAGRLIIDVSSNPGRRALFPHMYLIAAAKMWFGGRALQYFSEARLLSFPHGGSVSKLPWGVVAVDLYSDPRRASHPIARRLQKSFRDWIGMDILESQAPRVDSADADPCFEVHERSDGTKLITHYVDEHGRLVSRSKATSTQRMLVLADGSVEQADNL